MKHRGMVWLVALALVASGAAVADAKTYRWVDGKGVVHYSDTPPQVAPVEGERESLIAEALDISGLKKSLELIPGQIKAQIEQQRGPTAPKDKAGILKILTDAFRPEVFYNAVRGEFQKGYDPQLMGLVVARLREPLFRKMAALELEASSAEARPHIERFAREVQASPPPQTRLGLIVRLEASSGAAEFNLELLVASFQAAIKAVTPMIPPERRAKPADVDSAIRMLRAQQQAIRAATLVNMLFAYRSTTDQELDEYAQFAESEPGRWFSRLSRQGVLAAMTAAAEAAARQTTKSLLPKS